MPLALVIDDEHPLPRRQPDRHTDRFCCSATTAAVVVIVIVAVDVGARGVPMGLRLALVAQHVRLHSGRVWVTDRPGGGARFVVELGGAR